MDKIQSLSEALGTAPTPTEPVACLVDIAGNAEEFCQAVLDSREFRHYIVAGLTLGSLPSAVLLRVMDLAGGWQKPPDRVEHTGKDGKPIEITRIERVIVDPKVTS